MSLRALQRLVPTAASVPALSSPLTTPHPSSLLVNPLHLRSHSLLNFEFSSKRPPWSLSRQYTTHIANAHPCASLSDHFNFIGFN